MKGTRPLQIIEIPACLACACGVVPLFQAVDYFQDDREGGRQGGWSGEWGGGGLITGRAVTLRGYTGNLQVSCVICGFRKSKHPTPSI